VSTRNLFIATGKKHESLIIDKKIVRIEQKQVNVDKLKQRMVKILKKCKILEEKSELFLNNDKN